MYLKVYGKDFLKYWFSCVLYKWIIFMLVYIFFVLELLRFCVFVLVDDFLDVLRVYSEFIFRSRRIFLWEFDGYGLYLLLISLEIYDWVDCLIRRCFLVFVSKY